MSPILVVDDMAVFREPIAAAMRQAGHEVICAADGEEALRAIRTHAIDLVLLDLAMPKKNGIEVMRELRADPHYEKLPVILLTAISDKKYIVQAGGLGVRDYLLKSRFSLDELQERVAMRLQEASDALASAKTAPADHEAELVTPPARSDSTAPAIPDSPTPPTVSAASTAPPTTGNSGAVGASPAGGVPRATVAEARMALKAMAPLTSKRQIEEALNTLEGLRGFSPALLRLLKLTGDPRSTIDAVVKAICQDHAVALKVLQLANSVAFSRGEPVDGVRDAVLRIGMGRIHQVVLNLGVIERFNSSQSGAGLHAGNFWEHAIACGVGAAAAAQILGTHDSDVAFTAGLLHDVGRLVLLEMFEKEYLEVLRVAGELELPLEQVERHLLEINHAAVMEHVLRQWKFSAHIIYPIVRHHASPGSLSHLDKTELAETATLILANRMAHAMLLGCSGNPVLSPLNEIMSLIPLKPAKMAQIECAVVEQTANMKIIILAKSPEGEWQQERDRWRDRLPHPFRPLFHGALPEADGCRLLCAQLGEVDDDEIPNMGVLHVGKSDSFERLAAEYLEAEEQRVGAKLPLIVVSGSPDPTIPKRLTAGRSCEHLQSPTPISRFIRAVGELSAGEARAAAA